MNISDIQKQVEDLSQSLVFIDPEQTETLASLPETFGDLAAVILELGQEDLAEVCRAAIEIAARFANGNIEWDQGLDILSRTTTALQTCLHDECTVADADFPTELIAGPSSDESETPEDSEQTLSSEPTEATYSEQPNVGMVDDSIISEFLFRQTDILQEVEKQLLGVESGDVEADVEWLMRFLHTLKGESALLGLPVVAELCHAAEDMMNNEPVKACIDRLLEVQDWCAAKFKHLANKGPAPVAPDTLMSQLQTPAAASYEETVEAATEDTAEASVEEIPEETAQDTLAPEVAVEKTQASPAAVSKTETYDVVDYTSKSILEGDVDLIQDFVEEALEHLEASEGHLLTIESDPQECEALNAVFRGFHTIKGLAGFIELDHVKDLAHKAENLLDMARRDELELVGNNMDLVFESVDMMKRLVEGVVSAMGSDGMLTEEDALSGLMVRLLAVTTGEQPTVTSAPPLAPEPESAPEPEPEPAPEASADKKDPKEIKGFVPLSNMKAKKKAPAKEIAPTATAAPVAPAAPAAPVAAKPKDVAAPAAKSHAPTKLKEAVRVDAERLDRLIETIGELVIADSMVSQSQELRGSGISVKLSRDLDHLDKICRELQQIGMSLRMVPVRPVFQKMARLVRDLAKKQNRLVDFVTNGEDTELDKNVVDKIGDPLVHMVRNSVDHGIEPDPADRVAGGKPERGTVELRAFHKGGNICIEIQDDGRGLDKERILAKAISRGLVREGENLSDREIFSLIFEPGFSTAAEVTEISGRGVGMDVVRRNIEELRGTVDITSEPGKGSTFSIRLPLTLAIIEGMVVLVGKEHYIIPTLSVVRLIRPQAQDINHVFDKGETLAFEGSYIPLFRLSSLFNIESAKKDPTQATVVVVEDEGKKVALMADDLLGQQSIVIKSLGETIQGTDGVAGGAIMSDGNVALITDITGIVRVAHATDTTVRTADDKVPVAATIDPDVGQTVTKLVRTEVEEGSEETIEGAEVEQTMQPV